MKIKVKVKKHEYQSPFVGLIVTAMFTVFCAIFLYLGIKTGDFKTAMKEYGVGIIFSFILLPFVLYFFYLIIRPAKRFSGKLIYCDKGKLNGEDVVFLEYDVVKKKRKGYDTVSSIFKCYTYNNIKLEIGKYYNVYIKTFNWKIKSISTKESSDIIKVPSATMLPVIIAVFLFFLSFIVGCILGIIFDKAHLYDYILVLAVFVVLIILFTVFAIRFEKDNTLDRINNPNPKKLFKYKKLTDNGKPVGNIIIKDILKYALVIFIIWLIICLLFAREKFLYTLPTIAPLAILLLILIPIYAKNNKKTIEKYNCNPKNNFNLTSINSFRITRTNKSIFRKFIITDNENNLLYNVQKTGFLRNKYIIYTSSGKKVAEINKYSIIGLTYIVRPINEEPYTVRLKLTLFKEFEIQGLKNYAIFNSYEKTESIITNEENGILAYIAPSQITNGWYKIGDNEVRLEEDVLCNLNIVLISLCVSLGSIDMSHMTKRK